MSYIDNATRGFLENVASGQRCVASSRRRRAAPSVSVVVARFGCSFCCTRASCSCWAAAQCVTSPPPPLPTCVPAYLPNYLRTYRPPPYLPSDLPTYLPSYLYYLLLPTCQPASQPACLPTYLTTRPLRCFQPHNLRHCYPPSPPSLRPSFPCSFPHTGAGDTETNAVAHVLPVVAMRAGRPDFLADAEAAIRVVQVCSVGGV